MILKNFCEINCFFLTGTSVSSSSVSPGIDASSASASNVGASPPKSKVMMFNTAKKVDPLPLLTLPGMREKFREVVAFELVS